MDVCRDPERPGMVLSCINDKCVSGVAEALGMKSYGIIAVYTVILLTVR